MSRPFAETIPAVTVPPRPNGLPTASTQSPMRGGVSAERDVRKVVAAVDLDQRKIGARIGADHARGIGPAVVGGDLDAGCPIDDVIVGHGIAVGRDEEARALAGDVAPPGGVGARWRGADLLPAGTATAIRRWPNSSPSARSGGRNGPSASPAGTASSAHAHLRGASTRTRTEITAGFTRLHDVGKADRTLHLLRLLRDVLRERGREHRRIEGGREHDGRPRRAPRRWWREGRNGEATGRRAAWWVSYRTLQRSPSLLSARSSPPGPSPHAVACRSRGEDGGCRLTGSCRRD